MNQLTLGPLFITLSFQLCWCLILLLAVISCRSFCTLAGKKRPNEFSIYGEDISPLPIDFIAPKPTDSKLFPW
jgi:hypothetical protein